VALHGQNLLEIKLDGSEQGKSLATVLAEIESKQHARFYFAPQWIESISFQQNFAGQTLAQTLDVLFSGTDLTYISPYPQVVVILHDPTQAILHRQALARALSERKKVEQRVIGNAANNVKGKKITISGTVTDSKTKAIMPGTNIRVSDSQSGAAAGENGKYSLTLDPGAHVINFTFVDYEEKVIDLVAYEDAVIDVEMNDIPVYLDEVVVEDKAAREVATVRIGQTQLSMKEMKRAPVMLGEVDLVRKVQMLPGVTTVGEAASGFNVRGGSVDQNLILYDGMQMFNSSHVFGLLSTFNPEAVRDVSFYRGGIPAEFGGRASSVLDVRAKDGDYEKWNGNVGIGIITGNFMINGPIQKGKTSMTASIRSTYSDWLIHSIRSDYGNLKKSSVFFYDANFKVTHLFSMKTKLSVTGYSSKDKFRLLGDSTYNWSNVLASVRLDHQFSDALTGEFTAGESIYSYALAYGDTTNATNLNFQIKSTIAKAAFNYQLGKHKFNFGWQGTFYRLNPGSQTPAAPESTAKNFSLDKQSAYENAFFGADSWSLNEHSFLEAGVRLPLFMQLGQASVYSYAPGVPREALSITDTTHYGTAKPVKTYVGVEPRLAFRRMLTPTSSFKAGYSRVYQFLHLVSNSTAVSPVDIWQPSGKYFKPQIADQWAAGNFSDLKDNKYSMSAELFYKRIQNIVDFKDGAQLILNKHIETELLQGKGWSYGVETSFTKNIGKLTGSLNYTYSRSFRRFAGPSEVESINDGKAYPSNYDQPHILNLNWRVGLTRRHYFTGNFTYHTGRPVTIPLASFSFDNIPVSYFSGRNQYRIPDYHRLDLALVIEGNHRRKKLGDGTWIFSIYNVYARKNVYTVFFRNAPNGVAQPYQLSIIGTILPSISYNFKF
jgi:hypothetical protein